MSQIFINIFHGRFPSEKAAPVHIAESTAAFGLVTKQKVVLLVPRRFDRFQKDPVTYYKVAPMFVTKYLPTIDLFFIPFIKAIAFRVSLIAFSVSCFLYVLFKTSRDVVLYSNEHLPLLLISLIRKNIFYEVHDFPEKKHFYYRLLLKRSRGIITNNYWKREPIHKKFGIPLKAIHGEPNAVRLEEFDASISKQAARAKLDVPQDKKLVVYTGNLFTWKGVDTLAQAADFVSDEVLLIIVGGSSAHIERFRKLYGKHPRIRIVGYRPREEMVYWQAAADILALPNTAKEDISKYYTSPMKLFEYMAMERPIIAARIPSLTQVLHDQNSILVTPDDPEEFGKGIMKSLQDQNFMQQLTKQARQDVEQYTWHRRALRIHSFINQRISQTTHH